MSDDKMCVGTGIKDGSERPGCGRKESDGAEFSHRQRGRDDGRCTDCTALGQQSRMLTGGGPTDFGPQHIQPKKRRAKPYHDRQPRNEQYGGEMRMGPAAPMYGAGPMPGQGIDIHAVMGIMGQHSGAMIELAHAMAPAQSGHRKPKKKHRSGRARSSSSSDS